MGERIASMKICFILVLVVLLSIFFLQNTEIVESQFLFWHLTVSRVILLLGSLAVGFVIGVLVPFEIKRQKSSGIQIMNESLRAIEKLLSLTPFTLKQTPVTIGAVFVFFILLVFVVLLANLAELLLRKRIFPMRKVGNGTISLSCCN